MFHPLFTFTDNSPVVSSGAGNWNFNKANRTLKLKRGKTVREVQAEAKKVEQEVQQVPVLEIPKPIPLELFPSETDREIARLMREVHEEEYQKRLEEANQFYQRIIELQKLYEDEMEIELLMSAVLH
jgi:hypothetical protein